MIVLCNVYDIVQYSVAYCRIVYIYIFFFILHFDEKSLGDLAKTV